MKKRIIITLILIFSLISKAEDLELDSLPLKEYISMISSDLKIAFVISEDIDQNFTLMLPKQLDESEHLKILVQVLKQNNLTIKSHGSFFVISKKKEESEQNKVLQFITLKHTDYDSVKSFFLNLDTIKHSYIANNKTIAFFATPDELKRISTLIKTVDIEPEQLKLKVSIVDTNVNKLREFGSNLQTTFTDSSNFYFNLLAYPFEIKSELTNIQSNNLTSYFKFLNQNDISNLISSPTITIFDNVPTSISAVKNIPVRSGTTTQKDNTTTSTETISYRDVGLVLNINPKIYKKFAYLDMEIINETLTTATDTPTTAKNTIRQRIKLLKNKTYVLTGINQKQNFKSISRVPLLSDLPLVDWLFKMEENENIDSNLTIILQLVDDEYIETKNNIDVSIFKKESKNELSEHQKRVNKILGVK